MSDGSDSRVGPPLLHDRAPPFQARTTMGDRSLSDYRDKWLLLFSHPADFTPVCTSEFIGFAKVADRFEALGCSLLALSVDSLFSHIAWIRSIHLQFGVKISIPHRRPCRPRSAAPRRHRQQRLSPPGVTAAKIGFG